MQRPEIKPAVEAVGECRQVPSGILSEVECMVAATQTGLEVTEDGVDPLELGQVFRLSSRDDGGLMYTARLGDRAEAGQPMGTEGAAHGQVGASPRRNRLEGENGHRRELDAQRMALIAKRDCGPRKGLCSRSRERPCRRYARRRGRHHRPESGLGVALFACVLSVHQLVLNEPRRSITHPQLALERERPQPGLGLTDQADGKKPDRQPKPSAPEDRAGNQRGLMTAGIALKHFSVRTEQNTMRRRTTAKAAEALGPARGLKRRFALGLGPISSKKDQASTGLAGTEFDSSAW